MKDPFDRTKVVLRHLPPAISQAALMEQIDGRFTGRYKWVCFRPGKNSQKNQRHSRVYIDLKMPEDVVDFAEFFDGRIFVNEKGSQFKALVEYAPSQRVPKAWSKNDGREGTIFKDPEYLEFLERLAKPVENLPSAEIQLERREAERVGGPKETVIVTPLMEFIRQKRAVKSGSQRSSANGKISRRAGRASPSRSSPSRRASEKRRVQTSMYVLRDSTKKDSGKEKSTYMLMSRREESLVLDKSVSVASASGAEALEDENVSGGIETGKRRVVLLKAKEKESSHSQRNEASGMIIRSILSNKDARQTRSNLAASQSEPQTQAANLEKDKRPPRPPKIRPILKDLITDGSHTGVETLSSPSVATQPMSDSLEGIYISQPSAGFNVEDVDGRVHKSRVGRASNSMASHDMSLSHGEIKPDMGNARRNAEIKILGSGRANVSPAENGSHRHVGRRGVAHGLKEVDGSLNFTEGKPSKRGGSAGYGSHERQVWVQKSSSGS